MTFSNALEIINKQIQSIEYPNNSSGLYDPVEYLLSLKGKKIRPALTLLACNMYQDDINEAINTALAWEIFHNFTLMHDDVMDKADYRRGQPTVHKKWNENTAILSGDAMLILSYMFMAKSPTKYLKELFDLFSETASEICEGQQLDMEFEKRTTISEKEYIEMIRLKTAVMFGACLKSGAMIGGACESDLNNLYDFGINLGLAFQIKDDWLDLYGDPKIFGKKTGGDILCNKKTFLLVKALQKANEEDEKSLLEWMGSNIQSDEKIFSVRQLYDKLSISEKVQTDLQNYCNKALLSLQKTCTKNTKTLVEITNNLIKREN